MPLVHRFCSSVVALLILVLSLPTRRSSDLRGGAAQVVVPADRTDTRFMAPWWPHFLPDGKRFLYLTLESDPSGGIAHRLLIDRKSTRLNSSHLVISYAVVC